MADVAVMEVDPHREVAELTPEQKEKSAESKRLQGNELYKCKKYSEAIQYYSEAIDLCPTGAPFYGNRSAAFMMIENYEDALEDARQAILLDNTFLKAYLRAAKCHVALGNLKAAVHSYNKALEIDPSNQTAVNELKQTESLVQLEDRSETEYNKGDYRTALFCMDRCVQNAPRCVKFSIRKAELLVYLARYSEAQEIVNDILRLDSRNADAIFVRGLCLYYEDHIDKAFQHFQQVLRFAPDHVMARDTYKKAKSLIAKKEEGNQAFRAGKLEEAQALYSQALLIDPYNKFTNSKLYNNRATVLAKQKKLEEAINDCTKAIELDESYLKAYLRRGKCYIENEQYEEAVRDYEKVFNMDKTKEHKRLLQEAKLELKKSKRKDFYKILGVDKNATDDEIKKAYRKRALAHHPDRHAHDTEEKQKEEEKIFKEIGEAYTILSDPKKKARFDRGDDLEEMGGFDDFDPNTIFQAFFGGSGGHPFNMGGGMGGFGGGPGHGFTFHFG